MVSEDRGECPRKENTERGALSLRLGCRSPWRMYGCSLLFCLHHSCSPVWASRRQQVSRHAGVRMPRGKETRAYSVCASRPRNRSQVTGEPWLVQRHTERVVLVRSEEVTCPWLREVLRSGLLPHFGQRTPRCPHAPLPMITCAAGG